MKLASLLKSLQPNEYKDFEKFLQSPFFKASAQYLKFFKFLCKHHPSFELEKAEVESAYRRCFGPTAWSESKLYNLLSGMSKQIEQFLVVRLVFTSNTKNQNLLYNQLLVKSLGMRNMGAYFRAEAHRLIEHTETRSSKEIEDYFVISQLHHQVYFNPDTPKFQEHPPHLQLAAAQLDLYYCLAKLRYAAEMKARARILNVQYQIPLLDAVLARTADPEIIDSNPLLAVYHHLVCLYLKGVDESSFKALMELFFNKFPLLSKLDQRLLLRHLINCGIMLMARDCAVEADLLTLYKQAIAADMLLDGQRITHLSFINIANLASLCHEFEWGKGFISQFAHHLEDSKRQAAIDLAEAGLYYNQGMLDKAQTCLTPDIFPIASFDIMGRALLIKIAFDRFLKFGKDYEFLSAQLIAFERYMQAKPLTIEKKNAQLNWIKFVRKMAATKFEKVRITEPQKHAFREKLQQSQPIVSKKWLMERIDAL